MLELVLPCKFFNKKNLSNWNQIKSEAIFCEDFDQIACNTMKKTKESRAKK